MDFQTKPLSKNFGAEILDINLTQIDEDMAEAILSTVQKHALLLFRRQSLHDDDIYRLSKALGPVEEPPASISPLNALPFPTNITTPISLSIPLAVGASVFAWVFLRARDAYRPPTANH